MEYEPMALKSPLVGRYGLAVRNPVGQRATAVLENLTEGYDLNNLIPILDEMRRTGVKNLVLDLSKFPATSRRQWLAFLGGVILGGTDFKVRYTGITVDEADFGEPAFRDYIAPQIAESLDAAVESLSK